MVTSSAVTTPTTAAQKPTANIKIKVLRRYLGNVVEIRCCQISSRGVAASTSTVPIGNKTIKAIRMAADAINLVLK